MALNTSEKLKHKMRTQDAGNIQDIQAFKTYQTHIEAKTKVT